MSEEKKELDVQELFPDAIKNEEFVMYYQPKVSLRDYRLAGAEALCRWLHEGSLLPPFKFIPVFEANGQIIELDFYILEHVCMDIRKWIDEGRDLVRTSVNLSRVHEMNAELVDQIVEIIDKYRIPHDMIEIELTETMTDVGFQELRIVVGGLAERGIHTSVDDFGVGFSSLNLICDLPWSMLKIDKGFVPENADANTNRKVMLRHLIALARDMGLECLAEGVESVDQVKMLKDNGCMLAQGYFFDKPLPREMFESRMAQNTNT